MGEYVLLPPVVSPVQPSSPIKMHAIQACIPQRDIPSMHIGNYNNEKTTKPCHLIKDYQDFI